MPRASNNGHRTKVAWILGGLVGCCGLLILAAWNLTGIGPSERSAEQLYAEVQALGVPLDTDAFEKSLEVPANQNNAPELTYALAKLNEFDGKNGAKQKTSDLFKWHDGPTLSPAEQSAILAAYAGPMKEITDHISRPHFVIKRDWSSPLVVLVPEGTPLRLAAKLCCAKAVYCAQSGNREGAVQSLRDGFKLSVLAGDCPALLTSALTGFSTYAIAIQSVVHCIQLDPAGTNDYVNTVPDKTVRPVGLYLKSEAFMFAGSLRNLTWQTQFSSLRQASEGNPIPPPKYHKRNGPPTDPFVRAEVGYGLQRWLPIMQALNADGTPKDKKAFLNLINALMNDLDHSEGGLLGGAFQVMTPMLTQLVKAWDAADGRRDLARAYAQVVSYRQAHGRWPPALPEAGVTQLDILSPTPRPFGYRVDAGGMRIWSVGRDGTDDGGLISQERKSEPDSPRDDVFVFREKLGLQAKPKD